MCVIRSLKNIHIFRVLKGNTIRDFQGIYREN